MLRAQRDSIVVSSSNFLSGRLSPLDRARNATDSLDKMDLFSCEGKRRVSLQTRRTVFRRLHSKVCLVLLIAGLL